MNCNVIDLSVRGLVDFILRSGSIDSRYRSSKRAVLGTEIHSKVQKRHKRMASFSGLSYENEVVINVSVDFDDFVFNVDGRIDGLVEEFYNDGSKKTLHIEEIKSVLDIENIRENFEHSHFAQAKCYAYMYALSEGFSEVCVYVTYCHIKSYEEKTFSKKFDFNELKQFFYDLLGKYLKWQKLYFSNAVKRNETIRNMGFPFDSFRKGQREFAAAVYKTLFSRKKIFAQAPTGTGKTVSTVFPALKFVGENNLLFPKIFYATAKTITRENAENIINKMRNNGLFVKSVSITAKDKICPLEECSCTPIKCHFADGHFDRVNDALFEMISNEEFISKNVILKYSEKFRVCPFELSLDVTLFSDFIICDYNYIFDPKIQFKRFFGEGEKGDFIVLADEAHNLPDRAREMFSAEISKNDVLDVMKELKDKKSPLYKVLAKLSRYISKLKRNLGNEDALISKDYPEELIYILFDIQDKCDKWLGENEGILCYEIVLGMYFKVLDFIRISELFSKEYVFLSFFDDGDFKVKLLCLNPSELLAVQEKKFLASVFFSATLTPVKYFIDILGGSLKDNFISLPSPFKRENLEVIIDSSVSTKFKDRDKSLSEVCGKIFCTVRKMVGNHFVFFPSYEYMEKAADLFMEMYKNINISVQPRNLSEEQRLEFLELFIENPKETFVAFAVMGGVFSEGIDLVGSRLCGAIIIGVGLPLITIERDIIKEYYNAKNGNGFDYAYTYPGFNKVLQAAGRVIRTEEDKGYIMLIDSRFSERKYKDMFPLEWK